MTHPRAALYKALCKASMEYPSIKKSAKGAFGQFAPYEDIRDAVVPVLAKNNLSLNHFVDEQVKGERLLITEVTHDESGECIRDRRYLISEKPGNQGWGSAESYAKRYAVQSLLGICAEADDDGDSEQRYIEERKKHARRNEPMADRNESLEQLKKIILEANNGKWILSMIYKNNNVSAIVDLSDQQLKGALKFATDYAKYEQSDKE